VFTSDILYKPETLPKEMQFKISKRDNWHDLYNWYIIFDKEGSNKPYKPLSPHDANKIQEENENYRKIDSKTKLNYDAKDDNKENAEDELNDRVDDINLNKEKIKAVNNER
jgi:hypothetical protein